MQPVLLSADAVGYRSSTGAMLVRDIKLDIRRGDFIAIVGPNGAGKTTLLHMLCGMLKPNQGQIHFCGQPLQALSANERARRFAVIHQHNDPDRRLRVYDYIALGRIPHRGKHDPSYDCDIIDKTLEDVFLTSLRNRNFESLSGGERQRAILARALVQEPEILFLDEPANHLDPYARNQILNLICRLSLTAVMISHDLSHIVSFTSHAALLEKGQLLAFDETGQVMNQKNLHKLFALNLFEMPHPEDTRKTLFFDIPSLQ